MTYNTKDRIPVRACLDARNWLQGESTVTASNKKRRFAFFLSIPSCNGRLLS